MVKLKKQIKEIEDTGRPGFMMHIVAGYPNMESSHVIARKILEKGADILEVQIPFSDPVADGPVIAGANEVALTNGATVASSLRMIEQLVSETDKPVIIMSYFNIIYRFGVDAFCKKVSDMGVQGLIVPDYPVDEDEADHLIQSCKQHELAFVQVLASTSRPERIQRLIQSASGFVYCMARTGITGKKTQVNTETLTYLENVRTQTELPIAVGFGLSTKEQVSALSPHAQIMIVGSALIKTYKDKTLDDGLAAIESFMSDLGVHSIRG